MDPDRNMEDPTESQVSKSKKSILTLIIFWDRKFTLTDFSDVFIQGRAEKKYIVKIDIFVCHVLCLIFD